MVIVAQERKEFISNAVWGALAGALGVIVLDYVANFFYNRESKAVHQKEEEARSKVGGSEMGPSSVLVNKVSDRLNVKPTKQQFDTLSNVVHYSLGVIPGALYGIVLRRNKKAGIGHGFFYGITLFLVNDELLSVKLGLAANPLDYPWQCHARGLIAHVSMGMTTYWGYQFFRNLCKYL